VLRRALLEAVFHHFRPEAVILDYLPMGNGEEMFEFLAARTARRNYFVVRGVLADPCTVNQQILNQKGTFLLSSCYDRIFVAADRTIIDIAKEYDLASEIAAKLVYAGYIVDGCEQEEQRTAREQRGVPEGVPWVVCSAGGGKDGEDLIESCHDLTKLFPEAYFDIILGPRSRLFLTGSGLREAPRVRILKDDPLVPRLHAACDVLISRGGYNSMLEGVVGKPRVLVVPKDGDYEQRSHAERLSKFCAVSVTSKEELSFELERAVESCLKGEPKPDPRKVLDFNGASEIADHIVRDLRQGRSAVAGSARSRLLFEVGPEVRG
jgi:predicted glycosyltransferase